MKEEINMRIDFKWTFTGDADLPEDDRKYRDFLLEMYKASGSSCLLVQKEEEKLLKNYK